MFRFGVDYYPEHWPEERWAQDARLMQKAGFNVVRLAEFAWSRMEPREGCFEFDWLNRAIEALALHGLDVILGTPTASPPPWLMKAHPEIFMVLQNGRRLSYGNRRNYCPNNQTYREYSRRVTQAMAEHYGQNGQVIGWQTDNELGGQTGGCHCPVCEEKFGLWLRRRYGSLEEVNERWGTIFWSHVYNDWSEIPAPKETGSTPNPGLALDWKRFASDAYVDFQQEQIDILRQLCPQQFITHNLMGFRFDQVQYFDLAAPLDFVGYDIYVRMQWTMEKEVDPSSAALGHDTMRGLRRQNHWVIEQQSGSGGWEMVSMAPRPGELRLWAYQSIAHGADGIIFFRWRSARHGAEEFWHGVLDHHGKPGRRYEEIAAMGREIKAIGDRLHESQLKAPVAMLNDYDTRWAFQIQQNNPNFSYAEHFQDIYRSFYRQNVAVDVVQPGADLSEYKIVVAPALYVVRDSVAKNLQQYVQNGGTLLLTARSGVKDEANAVVGTPLPGLLAEMAGVTVEEYDSLPSWKYNTLAFEVDGLKGEEAESSIWSDVLQPTTAQVIARYVKEYYAGRAAITLNDYGQGRVLYVGTLGRPPLFERLVSWLIEQAGVETLLRTPEGVEASARWQNGQRILFLLNHNEEQTIVRLDDRYQNLLADGEEVGGQVTMPGHAVMILV